MYHQIWEVYDTDEVPLGLVWIRDYDGDPSDQAFIEALQTFGWINPELDPEDVDIDGDETEVSVAEQISTFKYCPLISLKPYQHNAGGMLQ